MSEISEEEDALLAKLLLKTDLVSEESVEMVRDLQSNLRGQGIKVSIVDLLLQSDLLSRSDLNSLRSLVEEETEAGNELMPARFEHPFLTQTELAERAKQEGVITDQTFQRMSEIQAQLEEQGISKTGGELLVEQGFVQPEELQLDESSSDSEFMEKVDESGEDIPEPSTPSQFTSSETTSSSSQETPGGASSRSRVMTELDRYVLEELVDRGRIERAQIPTIVEAARERDKEGSGGSAVQDELRDRGILHPTTESEVLSAAMDRREQAQQWQNRFGNTGPLIVTVLLIVCAAGLVYAFYGTGDEQTRAESTALDRKPEDTSAQPAASRRETLEEQEDTEKRQEQQQDARQERQARLTFEANVGQLLAEQKCSCEISFEGAMVAEVSGRVNEEGVVRISALPTSDSRTYAPGVYALTCHLTESAGASFPSFPSAFLYPLEEFGPTDQPYFERFVNGELWDFVTVAALSSSDSNVEENRTSFGRKLRTAVRDITEQWEDVEPYLSDGDPDTQQLKDEFRTLYQNTRTLKKKLQEFRSYRTFYYPSVRERVLELMDELPGAVARLMIKQRKQQDMDIPSDLRSVAGSRPGGSIEAIRALVDALREVGDRLPGEDESSNQKQFLKPVVREELRKLMQVEAVLRYLSNHSEVQKQAIQQDEEMVRYYFLSFYKYAFAQISLRSVFLQHTSQYEVFDEETGERIEGVGARMKGRLGQVIRELVREFNIDLPQQIPESNQFDGKLREHITETLRRAGIDRTVLELEQ